MILEYNDITGLTIYALLFNDAGANALLSNASATSGYTDAAISSFKIALAEVASNSGYYTVDINGSPVIDSVVNDWRVDIYQQVGGSPSKNSDILKSTSLLVWNGSDDIGYKQPHRIEYPNFLGTYRANHTGYMHIVLLSDYGIPTNEEFGNINYEIRNSRNTLISTGFLPYNSTDKRYQNTFSVSGFVDDQYMLKTSGTLDEFNFNTISHFVVNTGTITISNAPTTSDILMSLGYATGSVNDASATSGSFVTTLVSSTNDQYNGQIIRFIEGTLLGQPRIISDYVGSSKTLTVNHNFTSAPSNGSKFVVFPIGGELGNP